MPVKLFQSMCLGFMLIATETSWAGNAAVWLKEYYDNRGVCASNTTVSDIVVRNKAITVLLESEKTYIKRVKKGGAQIAQDWLALHCPLPMVAYGKILKGRDVVILVAGMDSLSCAAFEENRN